MPSENTNFNQKSDHNKTTLLQLIKHSKFFDEAYYRKQVPFLHVDPVEHYLTIGWKAGLSPSPYFNNCAYLTRYPDIAINNINPLIHYLAVGQKEKRQLYDNFTDIPSHIYDQICYKTSFNDNKNIYQYKRVAIFASYDSEHIIHDSVRYYLEELKSVVDAIIFVSDCYYNYFQIDKISDLISYCECARHGKYDFGSYQIGLQYLIDHSILENCNELILCNDSCYGPLSSFSELFKKIDPNVDFWGITNSYEIREHVQSYFLVFKKQVFTSDAFLNFFQNVTQEKSNADVVAKYELGLSKLLLDKGFHYQTIVNVRDLKLKNDLNPTKYPVQCFEYGSPFIKRRACLYLNYDSLYTTMQYIVAHGNGALYHMIKNETNQGELQNLNQKPIAFSFILVTYNRKKVLDQLIQSILTQEYQQYELIIIDNGSFDQTQEYILEKYQKEIAEQKIVFLHLHGHCSTGSALNKGLALAKNEWIVYPQLESKLSTHFLNVFYDFIIRCPKNKLFYARARCEIVYESQSHFVDIGSPFDAQNIMFGDIIDPGVFVHHISLYQELGGFATSQEYCLYKNLIVYYLQKYPPIFIDGIVLEYQTKISNIACAIDYAYFYPLQSLHTGVLFLSGWIVNKNNCELVLENIAGQNIVINDIYFYKRNDILNLYDNMLGDNQSSGYGFICAVFGNFTQIVLKFKKYTFYTSQVIQKNLETINNAKNYIEKILNFGLELIDYVNIVSLYRKYLSLIYSDYNNEISTIQSTVQIIGKNLDKPRYSLIIPIYGTAKFLDTQLMLFSQDQEILDKTEIIYVLDDPNIIQEFTQKAYNLSQLYNIGVQCVETKVNRGFSGANNIGASYAKGEYFIFMNSDVFPLSNGWIGELVATLEKYHQAGLVGCKLLYPDLSIQHASMIFHYREDLKLWTNLHPNAGLESNLDNFTDVTSVQAVTGACVTIRRSDFIKIDGWSTDYIIGDFEDSDFCLKVRKLGKEIVYNPHVQLIHLERQSFKMLENNYRFRLTLLNASIQQTKWSKMLNAKFVSHPIKQKAKTL